MAVVASPQYFASHPAPAAPHELSQHRCINFRLPSAGTLYKWEFEKARRKVEVGVEGPLISGDEGIVIDAALAGIGLAYVIEDQVTSLLRSGALTRALDDWCAPFPGFFLYYPGRRQVSPALAAFIDAIRMPAKSGKSVRQAPVAFHVAVGMPPTRQYNCRRHAPDDAALTMQSCDLLPR